MWPDTSRPPESHGQDWPCRGPPGRACRHGNGQATERGPKAHTSLRSIHNDVEENQPGITARK
jgi:hypothetical protein